MDKTIEHTYDLYRDIRERTNGEIYLGVVGPVRTGKSTFIKRFMELMVIPGMEDLAERERTIDELPQSAQGKTIMTTEPKFVPKDAAHVTLADAVEVNIRLVDCVGFLVEGISGHQEDGKERLVKTPWSERELPFSQAAATGTEKVIREHATIGIVITTDGSFTEIPRENYVAAEEKTVTELKKIGKPFVILFNTPRPYSEESKLLVQHMMEKYEVQVLAVNCDQLRVEDVRQILTSILYEFPIEKVAFYIPRWVELLPAEHPVKEAVIQKARCLLEQLGSIKDVHLISLSQEAADTEGIIKQIKLETVDHAAGTVSIRMEVEEALYYKNISELTGVEITGEYQLIGMIRHLSEIKKEYEKVEEAIASVKQTGYGVVVPSMADIQIEDPQLIHHGNKYGVKLKACSPSIHMIRANVETEVAPIIGSEEQAQDLVTYIRKNQTSEKGVWETKIFGKSIGELVEDGIYRKVTTMDEQGQIKLQDTMQKIINDGNGGFVCIIV